MSNLIRYAEHCRVLGNLLKQRDLVIRTLSALTVNQTYIDNDARHALPLKLSRGRVKLSDITEPDELHSSLLQHSGGFALLVLRV